MVREVVMLGDAQAGGGMSARGGDYDEVVQLGEVQLAGERLEVEVVELLVGGVNQRRLLGAPHDVGVVGGAVLQAKLDVEAVAV
jgi:hypothetical protein